MPKKKKKKFCFDGNSMKNLYRNFSLKLKKKKRYYQVKLFFLELLGDGILKKQYDSQEFKISLYNLYIL